MIQKITDYDLLEVKNFEDFIVVMKEMIEKGWQPYGFPSFTSEGKYIWYRQALVKYSSEFDSEYIMGGM